MVRIFIVLRSFTNPHGPQHGPYMGPRGPQNRPKWAGEIGEGTPFYGFDVGRPWKTDLGTIWAPSWGPLGPILGASGANLEPYWAHLGLFGTILDPLGGQLGSFRALADHLEAIVCHLWNILR